MKYVKAIGLEIEGGWFSTERKHATLSAHWHHDGSVRNIRTTQIGKTLRHIGEASSEPLSSLRKCKEWIDAYWPDRKNKSCGFHIHVSLDTKENYRRLMNEDFYILFVKKMKEFGETMKLSKYFFSRLKGENNYCRAIFQPFQQAEYDGRGNGREFRYCLLNYCYTHHGTLENRLPCAVVSTKKAYLLVEAFIKVIEEYLDNSPKKEDNQYSKEWSMDFADGEEAELVDE